jgi:hypothetical protein
VQELATEITESVMTALKTDGRPLTPAYFIDSTKGEAFVLEPDEPRRSSELLGTIRPTTSKDTI